MKAILLCLALSLFTCSAHQPHKKDFTKAYNDVNSSLSKLAQTDCYDSDFDVIRNKMDQQIASLNDIINGMSDHDYDKIRASVEALQKRMTSVLSQKVCPSPTVPNMDKI